MDRQSQVLVEAEATLHLLTDDWHGHHPGHHHDHYLEKDHSGPAKEYIQVIGDTATISGTGQITAIVSDYSCPSIVIMIIIGDPNM